MSTVPPAPEATTTKSPEEIELRIISHSHLFYWWPVWAVGFLMGLLTLIDQHHLAVVPSGAKAYRTAQIEVERGRVESREAIVLENPQLHLPPSQRDKDGNLPPPDEPRLHIADTGTYGVIFLITLLLVIVITNVPLRGLWSVIIIVIIVLTSIIFGLAGWWPKIVHYLALLDIRINMAGYFFISSALLAIWLITLLFFDRQVYMVFSPGSLKVCTEIGGGEKAYDTMGMKIEKQRSDLFRHWILGLGSGDLLVTTGGAHIEHFELPNVLFIGKKVQMIEDMIREKAIVKGR
jgi:hypothetical protein